MAKEQLDMSGLNERGEELAEEKLQSTVENSHNPNDCMKSNKHLSASHSEDSDISVWKLTFHYAKSVDLRFMVSGILEALTDAITTAAVMLILTSLLNTVRSDPSGNFNKYTLLLLYFSIGVWFAAFLEAFYWGWTAERKASRMRRKYLKAVLRHDEGFFHTQCRTTSQVVSSVTNDTEDVLVKKCIIGEIPSSLQHESYTSLDVSTTTKELLIEVKQWISFDKCAVNKGRASIKKKTPSSISTTHMWRQTRSTLMRRKRKFKFNTTFDNAKGGERI